MLRVVHSILPVANLFFAAFTVGKGHKVAFDCITLPSTEEGASVKSVEAALQAFLQEGKVYNYDL